MYCLTKLLKKLEKEINTLKQQVRHIGNKFLNAVEISAQEAAYLVLQLPLTKSTRDVIFLPTSPPEERTFLLKNKTQLMDLPSTSTDIQQTNIIQRYSRRPRIRELENICLADFASEIEIKYPHDFKEDPFTDNVEDTESCRQLKRPKILEKVLQNFTMSLKMNRI